MAVGVYCTFVPLLFGSLFKLVFASPLMLAAAPVMAPLLAVWNVFNPEVPLVFWRWVGHTRT